MLAVPVVFTSTMEFHVSAVYIGGNPLAEHESWKPGSVRTTAAGSSNITLGVSYKGN